jgi:hypothetical protein
MRFKKMAKYFYRQQNIDFPRVLSANNDEEALNRLKDEFGKDLKQVEEVSTGDRIVYQNQMKCDMCGQSILTNTAHLHQGKYIGDECCWDERLRTTE